MRFGLVLQYDGLVDSVPPFGGPPVEHERWFLGDDVS